jgi:hypothetical protein
VAAAEAGSGTAEMVKVLLVAGGTVMVMGPALEGKVVVSSDRKSVV